VVETTRWIPAFQSAEISIPGGDPFWLTNGTAGIEMLEDEVLFDVNINDVGVRREIEVTARGKKETVMHSLYFFQFVVGRIMPQGEEVPPNPHFVFRPQRPSGLVTPNGPGPMPGLPGGPPLG